jgi:hypothetical protein
MINAEKVYDDYLYDCHIANKRLTLEDWQFYGREEHHIEIPNRDGGVLTPLNSQHLTTYQHWVAGVLQSEVLQKMCFAAVPRNSLTGRLEELRAKWQSLGNTGESNGMTNKTHTEEQRLKWSEERSGEANPSFGSVWWHDPETGKHKKSKERPGTQWARGMSDEYKQQMSERLSGENNPRYGVTISEEQKQKSREKMLGRKSPKHSERMSGESNPQYGKPGTMKGMTGSLSPRYGKKQWVNAKGEKRFCTECPGPEWQNGTKWKG